MTTDWWVGKPAKPFDLIDSGGESHSLQQYSGQWVLLVLHRHLGCPACRIHVAHLWEQEKRLSDNGVQVLVVSFDSQELAQGYAKSTKLQWPLLIDETRSLYKAYGIPKASFWTLVKPRVLWEYAVTMAKGYGPGKLGCDLRQLGGNVLIDPDGIVRLNHVSTDAFDRPSAEYIVEMI